MLRGRYRLPSETPLAGRTNDDYHPKGSAGDEARREVAVRETSLHKTITANRLIHQKNWPTLGEAAFGGPVGELVLASAPYTEADPSAVLVQLLVMAGCSLGASPI